MNRQITKLIHATALAAAIGLPLASAPAEAGGSIGFYYSPRTARDARALDLGLRAYSAYNGLRSGAHIRQLGRNNRAGIGQVQMFQHLRRTPLPREVPAQLLAGHAFHR